MEKKLGVIHRGVRARRDFSPGLLKEPGRPEGQNLGAHVAPCGELPSFALLMRDWSLLPLEKPGVIHSPGAHRLLGGVAPGLWITPSSEMTDEPVLRSLVTYRLKPSDGDTLRLVNHRHGAGGLESCCSNPRQIPKRLSPRIG